MTLPLFDDTPRFDRSGLGGRLRALAAENIWIGTSSWKYPGWLEQIYSRDRYLTRGRFSQKRFEAECLAEYAETFPIVCGDFSFYQFPTPEFWQRLFATAPGGLRFALKVPEEVTAEVFPKHPRYGPRAGMRNESFLNADALAALFLEPLEPYRERIATLIFEFGARSTPAREFVGALGPFLDALPRTFRCAVEIRNRAYLGAPYFDCLGERNVAHVFNAWTKMPPLAEHIAIPGAFTADFTVVRALLREGRAYEQAVEALAPYDQLKDENPEGREALRALMRRMREERRAALSSSTIVSRETRPTTIQAIAE